MSSLLIGGYALKVKNPVRLPFVDLGTVAARQSWSKIRCRATESGAALCGVMIGGGHRADDAWRHSDQAPMWQDYRAMLFDLDGVITRTATLHAAAWKRLFDEFLTSWTERHGVVFGPFDVETDYVSYVDGRPRYEGVATFLRSRGIELEYGAPDHPPSADTCCGLGNRKNS